MKYNLQPKQLISLQNYIKSKTQKEGSGDADQITYRVCGWSCHENDKFNMLVQFPMGSMKVCGEIISERNNLVIQNDGNVINSVIPHVSYMCAKHGQLYHAQKEKK